MTAYDKDGNMVFVEIKESGVSDRRSDDNKVICPACNHEFQAIPVAVQDEIESLRQRVIAFESLETKRMKDAVTAEDWKRIAEHLEYQYKCCADGFNKTCGELRQRVKELNDEIENWREFGKALALQLEQTGIKSFTILAAPKPEEKK
jgi:hypothetical protein